MAAAHTRVVRDVSVFLISLYFFSNGWIFAAARRETTHAPASAPSPSQIFDSESNTSDTPTNGVVWVSSSARADSGPRGAVNSHLFGTLRRPQPQRQRYPAHQRRSETSHTGVKLEAIGEEPKKQKEEIIKKGTSTVESTGTTKEKEVEAEEHRSSLLKLISDVYSLYDGAQFDAHYVRSQALCNPKQNDFESPPHRWAFARHRPDKDWHVTALLINLDSVQKVPEVDYSRGWREKEEEDIEQHEEKKTRVLSDCYTLDLTGQMIDEQKKAWTRIEGMNCIGRRQPHVNLDMFMHADKFVVFKQLTKSQVCEAFEKANDEWARHKYNLFFHNCDHWVTKFRQSLSRWPLPYVHKSMYQAGLDELNKLN
eukprot:gnl/Spiro4/7505_TR3923_c0_g1_i2.p1 gnl/Spiro4/7505_TR3923_c0_g1~~gnl/Spiro4/7505_TR3923_c0_g1_i2.p1  ORF type:complete len:368 (-),score=40.04 gnl/Spiro4/7505_TR3923_c0_g1_i2:62-1165(-)